MLAKQTRSNTRRGVPVSADAVVHYQRLGRTVDRLHGRDLFLRVAVLRQGQKIHAFSLSFPSSWASNRDHSDPSSHLFDTLVVGQRRRESVSQAKALGRLPRRR